MIRYSAAKNVPAVEKIAETDHRASDGKNHADVVTNTAGTDALVDWHIVAKCSSLDMKVDESEQTGALSGSAAKHFVPTHAMLVVASTGGALNSDGTVNIGTTAGGTEIFSGLVTTGLTAVGATRVYPVTANTRNLLGNATLYANVEAAETGAGTLTLDVYIIGSQV